jgi:hypothetical protein
VPLPDRFEGSAGIVTVDRGYGFLQSLRVCVKPGGQSRGVGGAFGGGPHRRHQQKGMFTQEPTQGDSKVRGWTGLRRGWSCRRD